MINHPRSRFWRYSAAILFFAAALLFLGTSVRAGRQAPSSPEERWFVVLLGGTPVGYARESAEPAGSTPGSLFVSRSELVMVLNRLGARVELAVSSRTEETAEGRLARVAYEMKASVLSTRSEAVVKDGTIEIRNEAGGKVYTRTEKIDGPLLGPEGVRRLSLERIKGPGDRLVYRTFAAEADKVATGRRTALAWETVQAGGRARRLLKVEEELEGAGESGTAWLDADHQTLRQEMPTPFGKAEIVLSTREQALRAAGGNALPDEIYARSILKTGVRIPKARALEFLKVRITGRSTSAAPQVLESPNQIVTRRGERDVDLEVRRPAAPKSARFPVAATDENRPFLAPNAYIQSDDPAAAKLARDVLVGETDLLRAGLKLERWVSENMTFDLGIALAPSSELFKNRRGTCVGYATLLATLARAAGIPSRVVLGYVYTLGMFGGHAWTEILAGDAWVPLDAAVVAPGMADAARFAMAASSLYEGAGSLVGGAASASFGRIDVRVLEFRGAEGMRVTVPEDARPYSVNGDDYTNAWLGLRLQKPAGSVFDKLDAVWPDATVVGIESPDGVRAELRQAFLLPWKKPEDGAREILGDLVEGGRERILTAGGRPALAAEKAERSALVLVDEPEAWILIVTGKNAPAVMKKIAARLKIGG